ncbi:MAG TPA: hypothetical protein VF517_16675 [Thermoleophilaceae bacterium]|jgi:hypothetical protein
MPRLDGDSGEYLRTLQSEGYRLAPAATKRDIVWDIVERTRYGTLPKIEFSGFSVVLKALYIQILRRPYLGEYDVRPPRRKLFHPFGVVTKVRFDADGDSPYTGLFATGATGLARLSLAMNEEAYVSGMALKLFVDGQPSQNIAAVAGLDPQPARDFFAPPIETIIPAPRHPPFSNGWSLAYWWLMFVADPLAQTVDKVATVERSGATVPEPHAPHKLVFRPPEGLRTGPDPSDDFRDLLARIPPETEIYRVFAEPGENGGEEVYVGRVTTESEVIASSFADGMLSFRHERHPARYERRYRWLKLATVALVILVVVAIVSALAAC